MRLLFRLSSCKHGNSVAHDFLRLFVLSIAPSLPIFADLRSLALYSSPTKSFPMMLYNTLKLWQHRKNDDKIWWYMHICKILRSAFAVHTTLNAITYIDITSLSPSSMAELVSEYSHTTRSRHLLEFSVYPEQLRYIERICCWYFTSEGTLPKNFSST